MQENTLESREAKAVTDKEQIIYVLENHLKDKKLYLKDYIKKTPVKIQVLEDRNFKVFLPFDYQFEDSVTVYGFFKRYVEIKLKFIENLGIGRAKFEPMNLFIATSDRRDERYPVTDESIMGQSFKVMPSDNELRDILIKGATTAGVKIDLIFDEYSKMLSNFYPNVEIKHFHNTSNRLIDLVQQTRKILMIEDTQKKESYYHENDQLIDYGIRIEEHLDLKMEDFKEQDIRSLLIYPMILHRSGEQRDLPFGYIKIWSNEDEVLDFQSAMAHLNFTLFEMMQKIRKALLIDYKEDIRVLDICKGGVKILVESPELKKYFENNEEFGMELKFTVGKHNLDPLSFRCRVAYTAPVKGGDLGVGVAFLGSQNRGFIRLTKYIDIWDRYRKPSEEEGTK